MFEISLLTAIINISVLIGILIFNRYMDKQFSNLKEDVKPLDKKIEELLEDNVALDKRIDNIKQLKSLLQEFKNVKRKREE